MVAIVAAATLIMASSLVSINAFEELSPLPDYILFPLSSPVIPLVIEISDDPEVDKLISEVTKMAAFASGTPLPGFSARAIMLLENFLWKYSMGYTLYPWISLLESTLETSYKPQT